MGTPHYHLCTGDCPDGLTAATVGNSVGICGARVDQFGLMREAICELAAGHAGWHRDGGMSWTARVDRVPTREEHTEEKSE